MESSSTKCTPIVEWLEMKKEGIGELLNPIYFKKIVESLHYFTFTISTIVYRVGTICLFMGKKKNHNSHTCKQ